MAGKTGRRGHNEGSIYQRADGKWVGAVDLGWESGKRRRKVVYGKDRAEVSRKVTRLLSEHQRGLPVQTAGKSLSVFLDEWLEQVVKPTRSPSTYGGYLSVVNIHLVPALGHHKLDKLTQQHVQAMLNATRARGFSSTMVSHIRSTLRTALNQAMKWDLVGRNVAALTVPPRAERFEGHPLSPDEVRRVMAVTQGDKLEALFAIATSVGLRMGELLGLRWQDVDRTVGTLSIRHQLQVIDGKRQFVELKTKSSRRTISVPPPVLQAIRRHHATQSQQRLLAGSEWNDQDLVFCSNLGDPFSDDFVRDHWNRMKVQANIPAEVRFHDLRHSALTILASRGTPVRTLMGIAGHSNLATTMQIYAHLDTDNVRSSIDLMSDLYEAEHG